MNLKQFGKLKLGDMVVIQGNSADKERFGSVVEIGDKMAGGARVEFVPYEVKPFSYKSLRLVVDLEKESEQIDSVLEKESSPTDSNLKKDSLSKDDLISVVKTLLAIRKNYEDKYGVIMYANGETKKIEGHAKPVNTRTKEHNFEKQRGASKYKVRNIAIKKMRDAGYKYKDIAKKYGVSISQCRSVVILESRNEKNGYR